MFILYLAGANAVTKKKGHKRGMVISIGSSCIEIIFTLLAKPIAVQIRFSEIQVKKSSLERLLLWLHWGRKGLDWGRKGLGWGLDLIFNCVHVGLYEKLE